MSNSEMIMLCAIGLYMAFTLFIGIKSSRENNNVGDFYLGGRRLGPIVTAMSAEASDMSGWLLMGLPGVAYLSGIADAGWTAIGLAIGTYVNWLLVAKRLRKYSAKCEAITVPDFFAARYRDKTNILVGVAAVIIVVFFIPYTASGFSACGKLFSSLFNIDYHIAMIISGIVILSYTSLGGFLAASKTDLVQSIVMSIALVIVLSFGIGSAGGIGEVIDNAKSLPGYLGMTTSYDAAADASSDYGLLTIISTMAWGLGYFGMPHILLRFMAIEDSRKLKLSRRIASVWVVISLAVATFIGVIGLAMSKAGEIPQLEGSDSETVIVKIAHTLSDYNYLFAFVAGIILAGIFASTMSTADSQLLAASSSVSENIIGRVFGVKLSAKAQMLAARITLVVIAVIGIILAWDPNSSVFKIVSFAWAGFGATFGPVMLLALFWKRSNKWGAMAGMLTGGAMVFIWKFAISKAGGVFAIYELLPAFICACLVNVIVSLLTPAPEQEILDEFEAVKAEIKE
ncbi:MAG: sodium/proline symporter [Ruminococcus sp.]|nr:sodium/proline symporter [Ruminococcus sp.]